MNRLVQAWVIATICYLTDFSTFSRHARAAVDDVTWMERANDEDETGRSRVWHLREKRNKMVESCMDKKNNMYNADRTVTSLLYEGNRNKSKI
ncbi:hypothetical protein AG1IA_08282 [Rhizoctonia solani AG-1 IA]|uniref:Uncharacterized protein n=1 Tax=Thanatephorus cucumeris (strain AG1-IA) TaxID=983506 RepID=L8WLI2_THACA|nr:hypothetical protein AG1IA_08282 [Rhizoctonia solani AG-1 IA]